MPSQEKSRTRIAEAERALSGFGALVETTQAHLATYAGVEQIYCRIQQDGRPVSAIAINAGIGVSGEY